MSEYNFIVNPLSGRKVYIHGKVGKQVLANYKKLIQTGGHDGPCALNSKGTRCKKSDKWDHKNCELSPKKNCIKKTSGKKPSKKRESIPNIKLDEQELIDLIFDYGMGDYSEEYVDDALKILKKIKYDPKYKSWRHGYHINIQSVAKRYFKTGSFKGKVEDLYNDKSVHKQALKEQLSDRMTDITFWDNIANK